MIWFSFQKLFMFLFLKIIFTLPNDTILNNSKSILEVNYDSKTSFIKIGANEKKKHIFFMGLTQRTQAKEERQKSTEILELHFSKRNTGFRIAHTAR